MPLRMTTLTTMQIGAIFEGIWILSSATFAENDDAAWPPFLTQFNG